MFTDNIQDELRLTKRLIEEVDSKEYPILFSLLNLHFAAVLNKNCTELWRLQLLSSSVAMNEIQKQYMVCNN